MMRIDLPALASRVVMALVAVQVLVACVTGKVRPPPSNPAPIGSADFAKQMEDAGGARWRPGNHVTTLANGAAFYPAMLGAIRAARESVNFEMYVAVRSPQLDEFTEAFLERARAGVTVRLLLDAYGCAGWEKAQLTAMRAAGVEVRLHSPFKLWRPLRYNHRSHRRILVADGKTGFVGGAGIAYAWDGNAEDAQRWRDTMYQVTGPVVADLEKLFWENWTSAGGKRPGASSAKSGAKPAQTQGRMLAQSVASSPGSAQETLGSSYVLAFQAAREKILIEHSYFIPHKAVTRALLDARKRGVHVELLLPGPHTDMPLALPVARPAMKKLMAAGVEMHEYLPCMMHSKMVVVDGKLSIVGSGNLDSRSFFINDENNLHVLDAAFAAEQERMFEHDKSRGRPLGLKDLNPPPHWWLLGVLGRLVEHQL